MKNYSKPTGVVAAAPGAPPSPPVTPAPNHGIRPKSSQKLKLACICQRLPQKIDHEKCFGAFFNTIFEQFSTALIHFCNKKFRFAWGYGSISGSKHPRFDVRTHSNPRTRGRNVGTLRKRAFGAKSIKTILLLPHSLETKLGRVTSPELKILKIPEISNCLSLLGHFNHEKRALKLC